MKKFKIFFIILGIALFLTGCATPEKPKVNFEISLNDEMMIGEEQELKLVGDIEALQATWTVEDDSIIAIENGKVVALDEGFVSIYATYNGVTVETSINVSKVRKMKYELNGGTCEDLKTEFSSGKSYTLPTPKKEGYIFLGWYSNKSFSGEVITVLNSKNASIQTLYASWRSEQFTITYVLNKDGKEEQSEEYSLFKEDYALKNPEIPSDSVFSGWYGETSLINAIEKVEKGFNDDIKVYGYIVKKTADIKITLNANGGTVSSAIQNVKPGELSIAAPTRDKYNFVGWYKDHGLTTEAKDVYKDCYLYAKWEEVTPVQSVAITNVKAEVERRGELQLTYTLTPANPSVEGVTYYIEDKNILSIDNNGLITGKKVGKTMVTVTSKSETGAKASIEVEVYEPDFFEVSYDTNSFVKVGETIKLNAKYHLRGQNAVQLVWSSSDSSVATVANGVVTGVKEGYTKIRASYDANQYYDFGVTVYSDSTSDVVKYIINANNSNIFMREHLGIGAGSPVYYMDIIGSVSKLLYNWDYEVNRKWEATQAGISSNHGGTKESTEFICVHYTGNMSPGANANANASYFASGGGGTSIHYTTGNDGIFSCLDDNLVGFHAGDGTSVRFQWYPTGVMYKDSDPTYPVWGISENSKFIINGQETTINVPTGTTAATEKVTGDTFKADGVEQPCINKLGLPFKVVNGEYYMGTTYWCYTQVSAGRICSKGGNNNSVGIESCVNEGSDLWYTWQVTAQLVAHLMEDFHLDITRVVGHHFYSAKDCPQPHLANNCEIWREFIELVKAEHERITTYKDYSFSMEIVDGNKYLDNNGRVSEDNEYHTLTYKVTITNNKTKAKETVTLSSIVEGMYIR